MVNVVEQVQIIAEFQAQRFEQLGDVEKIFLGGPEVFGWESFLGRLVEELVFGDSVSGGEARDPGLRADGEITQFFISSNFVGGLFDVSAVGMAIDEHAGPALAAEKVVDGSFQGFAFDVPESHVDGGDGGHGDRAATPVRAAIEVLPDVFRLEWVAADETRDEMIGQIRCYGQLAAVQRRVAETVNALIGRNLQGDEIPAGAGNQHLGIRDLHRDLLPMVAQSVPKVRDGAHQDSFGAWDCGPEKNQNQLANTTSFGLTLSRSGTIVSGISLATSRSPDVTAAATYNLRFTS